MINLFRMSLIVLVGVAIWAFAPATAHAVKAHSSNVCNDCHRMAGANPRGMTNLCVSTNCHSSTGASTAKFAVGDTSNALGGNPISVAANNSHYWGGSATTMAAAGSDNPSTSYYTSSYAISTNRVTCSICHDPHGEAGPTRLLRAASAGDLICQQCHAQWYIDNADAPLTHPIVADYATRAAAANAAALAAGEPQDRYKVAPDNSLAAGPNGNIRLVSNGTTDGVSCTSCHGTHFTDSDSTYTDTKTSSMVAGDGKLLRTDGPTRANKSALCQACHNYRAHGDSGAKHSITGTPGVNANTTVGCLECHSGHSYNNGNVQYYVLRNTIGAPYNVTFTAPYDYTAKPASYDQAAPWQDGVGANGYCEKCHGDADLLPGSQHTGTAKCMTCHFHNSTPAGFSFEPGANVAICGDCHGFPPHINARGDRITNPSYEGGYAYIAAANNYTLASNFKDEAATPHNAHAAAGVLYSDNVTPQGIDSDYRMGDSEVACSTCHGVRPSHNTGSTTVMGTYENLEFDSRAAVDGQTAPAYAGAGRETCNNVYCHSNGGRRVGNNPTEATRVWSFIETPYVAASSSGWKGAKASLITPGAGVFGSATECATCHGNTSATMTTRGNSAAHNKHLAAGQTCNVCHVYSATNNIAVPKVARDVSKNAVDPTKGTHVNQKIDINFDPGFTPAIGSGTYSAAAGTCSIYCHTDGNGGAPVTTADWDLAGSDCKYCHKGNVASGTAMSTGSHGQHLNGTVATLGRQMGCAECHSTTVSSDLVVSTPANHINGAKNIGIASDAAKTNCDNIKCHSNGNLDGTITYKANGSDYVWTIPGTLGCDDCHGNGAGITYPIYANGGVGNNSNSHAAHVDGGIACGECHASVSTTGASIDGTTPAQHVNQSIEVNGPKFTWTSGTETCSAITCHGGNSAQWGATALNCGSCHQSATADVDDFTYGNGTQSVVYTAEWAFSGHGKTTGTYEVTGRSAANFPGAAPTGDPCKFCHDGTVTHNAANYFRLRQNGEADLNGVCLGCHETGAAGVDPDAAGAAYNLKNATIKVNKYHQGAKHGDPRDGGRWCWDCHDPHGDASAVGSRIQMIQKRAQVNPNANGVPASLTGTDIVFTNRTVGAGAGGFARDITGAGAAAGLCNACHTTTSQYTNATGVVLHTTAVCTGCHSHNADNVYDGNAFQGSGCNGCHGSTGNGQYWPDGTGGSPVYVDNSAGSATTHGNHVKAIGVYLGYGDWAVTMYSDAQQKTICAFCHATPGAAGHDTNGGGDSIVDVLGAGAFTKFTGVGATATDTGSGAYAAGSCATLACHNGVASPASWNTPPAANCTTLCHGPNTVATAREGHQKHVVSKGYACTECHVNNGTNYGHINGEVNLVFANAGSMEQTYGAGNGSYSQAANSVPRDGIYGNCGNMYCHADKLSPNWDQTIAATGCSDCHTTGGASLNPISGLHTGATPTVSGIKHDETITGGCAACHTVAALGTHVNGTFSGNGTLAGDRTNMGLIAGYTAVGVTNNGTGTCAGGTVGGASCHAGGDAGSWARKWDSSISYGTLVSGTPCAGCHGGFGETDWTFGSVSNTSDGSVEHNRDWDADATTGEVIGEHKDNVANATRCNICHVYADAPYTSAAFTTYHRNNSIDMNSSMGYNTTNRNCTSTCHANNTNHNLEASGWTVANVAGPALSCYTCHGNGSTQYWPGGATFPNRAGEHQAHITALAAKLSITLPGNDAEQKRMCAYCHNDATGVGGAGHDASAVAPADLGSINPIWDTINNPPIVADSDANLTGGSCSLVDCHNNKSTSPTYDWYAGAATACAMCHTNGASDTTHTAHTAAGMGITINCLSCHGAGTTTTTAPTSGHIGGTLDVVGNVTFTYSGGMTGTCGTNACHYNGRYVTAARQAPKTSAYNWGTPIAGCDACHDTTNVLATGSHTAHLTTTSQAITCNSCHTAGTVATHIDAAVNFTGAAAQYNTSTPEPTSDETFTSCGINTCHNNGKNAAAYNNNLGVGQYFWNTAIGAVNSCTECHNNAALGELHSTHLNAAATFGINTITCDSCHTAGAAAGTHSGHVEATVALVAGLTYSGTPGSINVTTNTFGTCTTTTCHSNGRGTAVVTPAWNDAADVPTDCTVCHGNASANLTSGAHVTHIGTANAWGPHPTGSTNCGECHASPANNTSMATYTSHIDGTTQFTSGTTLATTTICEACHGGATASNTAETNWTAATRVTCESCHGQYSAAVIVGKTAPLNAGASYTTYGHNKVTNSAFGGKACTDCHDNTAAGHLDGTSLDDKRMKIVNTQNYTVGANAFCASACHSTVMNVHYANSKTAGGTSDDGVLCMTCHNPHGQNGNQDAMIRSTIAGRAVTGFTNKTLRASFSQAGFNGVCQACHDGGEVGHFSRTTNETTHNSPTLCTDCHSHTATTAFSAAGGGCDSCHGYPPVQRLTGAAAAYTYAKVEDYPGGGRAHAVVAHINPTGLDPTDGWLPCAPCHTETDHNMGYGVGNLLTGRDNSLLWGDEANRYPRVNVAATYDKAPATALYNMGNRATAAVGMGNCSNTTCHFGVSPKWDCLPADTTNDPQ